MKQITIQSKKIILLGGILSKVQLPIMTQEALGSLASPSLSRLLVFSNSVKPAEKICRQNHKKTVSCFKALIWRGVVVTQLLQAIDTYITTILNNICRIAKVFLRLAYILVKQDMLIYVFASSPTFALFMVLQI